MAKMARMMLDDLGFPEINGIRKRAKKGKLMLSGICNSGCLLWFLGIPIFRHSGVGYIQRSCWLS